ncbi:MAG: flagellar export chaperone FlgN [Phycisphaerales bacterium]
MPPTPTATASTTLTQAQCDALESLLLDLERHAAASARLADEHRAAVAASDSASLARCVAEQQQAASELSGLESRCAALMRSMGLRTGAQGGGGVTLTQLASLAPATRAPSLTAAAARVKSLMADAAQRRESVRLASLSLMAHMAGVVRQIARYMSDTKTYAPPTASPRPRG